MRTALSPIPPLPIGKQSTEAATVRAQSPGSRDSMSSQPGSTTTDARASVNSISTSELVAYDSRIQRKIEDSDAQVSLLAYAEVYALDSSSIFS